jgi:hypothetical protein
VPTLPADLVAPPPRPLPAFAPSLTWPLVIEAICLGASAWAVVRGEAFLADWLHERARAVAFGGAIVAQLVGLGIIAWALSTRSLLRLGTPVIGEVLHSKRKDAAQLLVRFRFVAPGGRKLERDFYMGEASIARLGFVPAAGDVAYVVHGRDPRRFYLWGFAKAARPKLLSYSDENGAKLRSSASGANHPVVNR